MGKVARASSQSDVAAPCDGWAVHESLSHMPETQKLFVASAQGREASPATPTLALSADPVADFKQARPDTLQTFGAAGAIDSTGPSLGTAFSDQLLDDLARATGQDETVPPGLAEAAFGTLHGGFTDEQRQGIITPEVTFTPNAPAQQKLLAYAGRVS